MPVCLHCWNCITVCVNLNSVGKGEAECLEHSDGLSSGEENPLWEIFVEKELCISHVTIL